MLRKIGGIWFVRLGRLRLSFCVARRLSKYERFALHARQAQQSYAD